MSQKAFVSIIAPGYLLRGVFPVSRLHDLVNLSVECIKAGWRFEIVPYDPEFAIWQIIHR